MKLFTCCSFMLIFQKKDVILLFLKNEHHAKHLFSLPHREQVDLSAVCVFSLSDISKVLDGSFKELKKSCDNWINHEPIPSPRPGQVLNCTFTFSMIYTAFLNLNMAARKHHGWFIVVVEDFTI